MARNEEKQLGRLNRWYLEKDRQEQLKKNPPRPKLVTLTTAEDIRKWIPSIKKDIDFNLKQSMVACYPQSKIEEFHSEVDRLQREYKAYVHKLVDLDPTWKGQLPWEDRPYKPLKRKAASESTERFPAKEARSVNDTEDRCITNRGDTDETAVKTTDERCDTTVSSAQKPVILKQRLALPILDRETQQQANCNQGYGQTLHFTNHDLEDRPLHFGPQVPAISFSVNSSESEHHNKFTPENMTSGVQAVGQGRAVLGLDYDSSSEDEHG